MPNRDIRHWVDVNVGCTLSACTVSCKRVSSRTWEDGSVRYAQWSFPSSSVPSRSQSCCSCVVVVVLCKRKKWVPRYRRLSQTRLYFLCPMLDLEEPLFFCDQPTPWIVDFWGSGRNSRIRIARADSVGVLRSTLLPFSRPLVSHCRPLSPTVSPRFAPGG